MGLTDKPIEETKLAAEEFRKLGFEHLPIMLERLVSEIESLKKHIEELGHSKSAMKRMMFLEKPKEHKLDATPNTNPASPDFYKKLFLDREDTITQSINTSLRMVDELDRLKKEIAVKCEQIQTYSDMLERQSEISDHQADVLKQYKKALEIGALWAVNLRTLQSQQLNMREWLRLSYEVEEEAASEEEKT